MLSLLPKPRKRRSFHSTEGRYEVPPLMFAEPKNRAGRTRFGFSLHLHPAKFRPPLAGRAPV
jgi:hypothetical protein